MKKTSFAVLSVLSLLTALLVTANSGCLAVAAGAGAGAVAYVRGDLETNLSHSLEKTAKAAASAVENLKFSKISEKQDALTAVIMARTAEDRRIEIKISSVDQNIVKVNIRVGVFGDERISRAILEAIKDNL